MSQLARSNINQSQDRLTIKDKIHVGYIFMIILAANEVLHFGSWWRIAGVFNIQDIGNMLIWLGFAWHFFRKGVGKSFWNPITFLIFFYIIFVFIQIALGSLNYGKSLTSGLIGTRHQFYFGSFFLFWALIDTVKKIRVILNGIVIISIIALILGIINYFGAQILTSRELEREIIRSGVERAFIPAMSLISLSTIWLSARWTENSRSSVKSGVLTLFFLGVHIFRQTRMRLFGVFLIVFLQFLIRKKFKLLAISAIIGMLGISVSGLFLPENIIVSLYNKSDREITQSSGSWGGRVKQLEVDYEEFMRHPFIGSGSSTLWNTKEARLSQKEWLLGYKADLGYSHWAKAYGSVGIGWLLLFFGTLLIKSMRVLKLNKKTNPDISNFCISFLGFILMTYVTLNHLMFPPGIVTVCLVAAIILRMSELNNVNSKKYKSG